MKARLLFLLILFTFCFETARAGSTYTWIGAAAGIWTTSTNWSGGLSGGYPGSGGNTTDVAQIGASNVTITLTSTITISSIQTPNYGQSGLTIYFSGSPTLTISNGISIAQPTSPTIGITFSGAGTAVISGNITFNYEAGLAIGTGATVTFTSGVGVGFNNPPTFTNTGTLNLNNASFSIAAATTSSGTINITGSSAIYATNNTITNNGGTINCTSGTINTSGTIVSSGAINCTSGAVINTSNTITNNAGTITCSACTVNTSNSITSSGTITSSNTSAFNMGGGGTVFTNNGTINASSTTFYLNNNTINFYNSLGSVLSATSCTFNMAGAMAYITNYGTFKATSSVFTFGNQNTITNTGSFTTQSGCTFAMNSSGNCTINNTGTYKDHGSTYTMQGQAASIQNSGPGATMYIRGTTINFASTGGGANGQNITNSNPAIFTADSASTISMYNQADAITNTGIFNAGTSGSACTININAQIANITNTGSSSSKIAYFNVGSTSVINLLGGYQAYVTNTANAYSVFTLLSDINGSASIGAIGLTSYAQGNSGFMGSFNVQRYLTGGTTTDRGYRLFSSPVNLTGIYNGSSTYVPQYITLSNLNKSLTVYETNYSTPVALNGAFTAGSGGTANGFSYAITNPTIYFYSETRPASDATFISGKHLGVTAIGSSTVTLTNGTSPSIPIANGYLLYFIGPNTFSTPPSGAPVATYVNNAGYINQGPVTVNLFYTPNNGGTAGTATHLSYTTPAPTGGAGFNMIGNPYACTINLATVAGHNSNITNFYLLDLAASPSQGYVTYSVNGTSAPHLGYVASGQGFIVQTKSGNNTFGFDETDKVSSVQLAGSTSLMSLQMGDKAKAARWVDVSKHTEAIVPQPTTALTGLYMKLVQDSTTYDYCGIYYRSDWSATFTSDDASDIDPTDRQTYMASLTSDGVPVSINHMPGYSTAAGSRTKLYVNTGSDGLYHLQIEDIRNIDTSLYAIFLVDNFKKDSLDIGRYGTYNFNVTKADTTTFGGNRFVLAIELRPLPAYRLLTFTGQKVTEGVQLNWKTANEGDYTGFVLQKQSEDKQFTPLNSQQSTGEGAYTYTDPNPVTGANIYRLQQNGITGNITYSDIITIIFNPAGAGGAFTVYPNPAKGLITVNVSAATAVPAYIYNIYNTAGKLMVRRTISANSWSEDVTAYKTGVYVLELTDTNGNLIGNAKFVKTN